MFGSKENYDERISDLELSTAVLREARHLDVKECAQKTEELRDKFEELEFFCRHKADVLEYKLKRLQEEVAVLRIATDQHSIRRVSAGNNVEKENLTEKGYVLGGELDEGRTEVWVKRSKA